MYPADLPDVDSSDLRSASEHYLSALKSAHHEHQWFQPPRTPKVAITARNVSRLQLFDDEQPGCTVLALRPPDRPTQVLALYLHEKWWSVDEVLQTSSESRSGLVSVTRVVKEFHFQISTIRKWFCWHWSCWPSLPQVQSLVERVIVFLLSQVVERPAGGEALFSLHPRTESGKLLWRDGRAVGFYTVKRKGSLCDSWSGRCYLLPVLDTVLVRRSCRRRGFGLHMLDDFCSSFSGEEVLGISAPLSASMVSVCRQFLQLNEEHRERLYEVEAPGGWTQRRNIWLNIQLRRYAPGNDERSNPAAEKTTQDEDEAEQKTPKQGQTSLSAGNTTTPLTEGSSEQRVQPCDPSREGSSLSSKISGTGCSPAAHAHQLRSGPPGRQPKFRNIKHAAESRPSLSAEPPSEKPEAEESHRNAKRSRRL